MDVLHPPLSQPRRRSVDVGGLSLALGSQGLGQGWVGWDESEIDTEEQQLLCVISPRSSTAVPRLICAWSVLQNFLVICTTIPTLLSMPTNNRMFNSFSRLFSSSYPIARAPIDVSLERRAELIRSLDNWHFEPHKLPDHEVLYCSLIIFEALFRLDGILDMVPVSIGMLECMLLGLSLPNPLVPRSDQGFALQHATCLSSPKFVSQL